MKKLFFIFSAISNRISAFAIALLLGFGITPAHGKGGSVIAWQAGSRTAYQGPVGVAAISSGLYHVIALKHDGTVEVWIAPWGEDRYRNAIIPEGLNSVVAVAAGENSSVALKSDGTIVEWGLNASSRAWRMPKNLSGVVAIAAGQYHTLALKADGTVVGWCIGEPFDDGATPPPGLTGVVAIAAGDQFSVALKEDGTLVGWGEPLIGGPGRLVPAGLRDVVAISARGREGIALKRNGTVEAFVWGSGDIRPVPDGLTNVTAVGEGRGITVVAKSNGTVASWVSPSSGRTSVSPSLTGVSAVSGLWFGGVALVGPSLSMHRLVPGEGAKVDPEAGVETPIVPVTDAEVLKNLPMVDGGVATDGVTPLIFNATRLKPNTNYTLRLHMVDADGNPVGTSSLNSKLRSWSGSGGWVPGGKIKTGTNSDTAFFYLEGFSADGLGLADAPELRHLARVSNDTSTGGEGSESADIPFGIRKPPVVLIHGYNTPGKWGSPFLDELYKTHPNEFILPIKYGVIGEDTDVNTRASLAILASVLNSTLKMEVERNDPTSEWRDSWAFTRYDVVAHSQGGVLARMLCSERANGGIPAFRDPGNFNRGRFNRVVTIGSPHNGSRLARYMFAILSTNNFIDLVTAEVPSRARIVGLIKHVVPNLLFQTYFPDWTGLNSFGGTLQPKFDPFGPQIDELNRAGRAWTPDSGSKFHFIVTGVDSGGSNTAALTIPAYLSLGLSPLNGNYQAVLPQGSDGVVDTLSQAAGLSAGGPQTTVVNSPRMAHSRPTALFGAFNNDVDSEVVGERVRTVLDVTGPVAFGPFPSLMPLLQTTKQEIDAAAGAVSVIVDELITELSGARSAVRRGMPLAVDTASKRFQFTPLPDHPPNGEVSWHAEVLGTNGVDIAGATVTPDLGDSKLVTVSVGDKVEGDVVLYASYLSTNGDLVFGMPTLVVSRPLGIPKTGIVLMPDAITMIQGQAFLPEIFSTYEGGIRKREFVPPNAVVDAISSDESILIVNTKGLELTAVSPGTATLTVNYQGFTAQVDVAVVLEPGTVGFSATAYTVNEASGPAFISVQRVGGTAEGVSVHYEVAAQIAQAGIVYTPTSGVLTFAEGEMSKTFAIPITNDSRFETDEVLHLTLSDASRGAALSQSTATLTIQSDDSFAPAKGSYSGLVRMGSGPSSHSSTGSLKLTLAVEGGFTGKLLLGGKTYVVKGSFNQNGQSTVTVRRKGLNSLTVSLQINDGIDVITGSVSDGTPNVMSVWADRAVYDKTNPTPLAGSYSAILLASAGGGVTAYPQSQGTATITISTTGQTVIAGVLGDGTKWKVSVPVSKDRVLRIHQLLYQNRGFIAGELRFDDANGVEGSLQWYKPAVPKDKFFPTGFDCSLSMTVSRSSPFARQFVPANAMTNPAGEAGRTSSGTGKEGSLSKSVMQGSNTAPSPSVSSSSASAKVDPDAAATSIVIDRIEASPGTTAGTTKATLSFTANGAVDIYASDDLGAWGAPIATDVTTSPFVQDNLARRRRFYVIVSAGLAYP